MCRRLHATGQPRICFLKIAPRGVQPRVHGSYGDAQTRGDLVAGFFFDFEKHEKRSTLDVERVESLLHDGERLGCLGLCLGARIATGCGGNRFLVELAPLACARATVRHRNPNCDPREPRRRASRTRDEPPPAMSDDEDFLHEIIQIGLPNAQSNQEPRNERGVGPKKSFGVEGPWGLYFGRGTHASQC